MADNKQADHKNELVLVTGVNGFVAAHVVNQLFQRGYKIRGTVRSVKDKKKYAHIEKMAEDIKAHVEFVEADLTSDQGWDAAVQGCNGVFHTASPIAMEVVEDENELIRPAVDGTLRVLRAVARSNAVSKDKGIPYIHRVVLTSSVSAIHNNYQYDRKLTEQDWTDEKTARPYPKSKVLAEKAAWNFVKELKAEEKFELTTVCPGLVLGPQIGPSISSTLLVQRIMNRVDPGSTKISFPIVDGRDVALVHVLAYEKPEAAGKRYIATKTTMWMYDVADVLAAEFNNKGYNVSTWRVPYFLLWTLARCDKVIRNVLETYGIEHDFDTSKTTADLGIEFRDAKQSIIETAYTMIALNMIPNKLPNAKPPQ